MRKIVLHSKAKVFNIRFIHIYIFIFLNVFPFFVFAQEKKPEEDINKNNGGIIDQRIENIAEQSENENIDYTNLIDDMIYYQAHPLNLNTATKQQLEDFNLLNEIQINNLLNHIEKNGKLLVIYEIQAIEGFDMNTIQRILPYVRVTDNFNTPNVSIREIFKEGQNQIFIRESRNIEQEKGFSPITDSAYQANPSSRYLGSADRLYFRYRFNYGNNVSWGVTGEKDAGEELFKRTQKRGFDFTSAHFVIRNIRNLKALAIGDYQMQIGQGIVFSSGIAYGKTADVTNVKRNYSGIKPYTSVNENIFLRGGAVTYTFLKRIDVTAFGSYKKIDANITTAILDSVGSETSNASSSDATASSLQISGFHRTPNELKGRNAVTETIYGGYVNYHTRRFRIGFTGVSTSYSARLLKSDAPYNAFEFSGNKNFNMGVEYNYLFRNINLFGEAGRSANGGLATIHGAILSLDPRLLMSFIYRNYQRNYQVQMANGFGENTRVINEKGFYMGVAFKPVSTLNIAVYYDRFEFPWMKYQVNGPSGGYDYFNQATYTPSKKVSMYLRFRQRVKAKNSSDDTEDIDYLISTTQQNYRYEVTYAVSPSVRLKNRVEFVSYQFQGKEKETGYMIYQDLSYKQMNKPYSVSLRYALFDTKSYNARIYAFETDVLYSYSIPGFYDKGIRAYIVFRYTLNRHIDLWLRAAQTYYTDPNKVIGSGLSEISGNRKSDFRLQVRYRF